MCYLKKYTPYAYPIIVDKLTVECFNSCSPIPVVLIGSQDLACC